MTVSLSVLDDLGINLYSNTAAVLSEAVANAWDADATEVEILVSTSQISIRDNGHGMTVGEVNKRFLNVGYKRRRDNRSKSDGKQRPVMGRKGIGKLALFAIAEQVTVSTKREDGESHALRMDTDDIRRSIEASHDYVPKRADPARAPHPHGTTIDLRRLKRTTDGRTEIALRRRLARRFSIIGSEDFRVSINGQSVSVLDRAYWRSVQYIWPVGSPPGYVAEILRSNATPSPDMLAAFSGEVDSNPNWTISGWIGTVAETRSLDEIENSVPILARGKLVHEDILPAIRQGGFVTKYITGELRADFLDHDSADDIATSDRQSLKETDPRFRAMKEFVSSLLRRVNTDWSRLRRDLATDQARKYTSIDKWFRTLKTNEERKSAKHLFSKIGALPLETESDRKELYKHGILAFERLRIGDLLEELDSLEVGDVERLLPVFVKIDDVEAALYREIARSRLEVIRKLTQLVDGDAKEKAIQAHLFNHLWLLSTSWERPTEKPRMEKTVAAALDTVTDVLGGAEKLQRLDIAYKTPPGTQVVIELKRYSARPTSYQILDQLTRYRDAVEKVLSERFPNESTNIELVAVVGKRPSTISWAKLTERLAPIRGRVVTYDELIEGALEGYTEFLRADSRVSDITGIFDELDAEEL